MSDERHDAIAEIQSAMEMPGQEELAPVYAEFGAAIHDTQALEFGLVLLMALATRYDDAQFDSDSVKDLSSFRASQTIGELFRAVRKKEHFTSPERKAIHKAINLRNRLVHRFMVEKVERLLSPDGRRDLLEELHAIRQAVQYADGIIASLMNRYLEEYGATLDELQDYATGLFETADAQDEEAK